MIASSLRSMATRERATHMPASRMPSASRVAVAFWRKGGGFEAFFRCRVGETDAGRGRTMFGKGRVGACALGNLQTARGAYIAVRNEASRACFLSEPVAARTRE